MRLSVLLLFAVAAALAVAQDSQSKTDPKFVAPPDAAAKENPLAGNAEAAAGGKKLFLRSCAECHGENGTGIEDAANLQTPEVQKQSDGALFWKVIIPGSFPFIITGLRQAFLRAWIAVVGAEMLAASDFGLGWVIFDAKEFLNTSLMLASLTVIGAIGFLFERLVFGSLERSTVLRWGMVRATKG